MLPGNIASNRQARKAVRLREALMDAVTPEQVQAIIAELQQLCLKAESQQLQLMAMGLFFERVLGKSSQELILQNHESKTVRVDFRKFPTEKLQRLQNMLLEGPVIDVTPAEPKPEDPGWAIMD
jgi:hypothetical protein